MGGVAGGRRLAVPPRGTRPTSERVREAVGNALAHRLGTGGLTPLEGVAALDVCAGSGALGLEMASRGARPVVLVERDRRAAAVAKSNVKSVGLLGVTVLTADAWGLPPRMQSMPGTPPVGILLVDPPYAVPEERIHELLGSLAAGGWLAPECWAVVERSARGGWHTWPSGWDPEPVRKYADTVVALGRLIPSHPAGQGEERA